MSMTRDPAEPEQLVIRPPSEWRSLLVRVTRGCQWNRCRFCGIYAALGEPEFSSRAVEEVKRDIDTYCERCDGFETAFLGDADPIAIGLEPFLSILRHLGSRFPELTRTTCYARASTLRDLGEAGIRSLADAGLTRVHVGLESGDRDLLRYHRKGQRPETVIDAGRWCRSAGIEVSLYVLLGMGGRDRWTAHIDHSADVINAVNPGFVRLRRIWLYGLEDDALHECPLHEDIRRGIFVPQTPEGTVVELRRLIQGIDVSPSTLLICDHANNYVRVEGRIPGDRDRLLAETDAFLALPEAERLSRYESIGSRI